MSADTDPIKHIVVLMLENRSFDHMLGSMKSLYPTLDGINAMQPFVNLDKNGNRYVQSPHASFKLPRGIDPKHEYANVCDQLFKPAPNGGFVQDFLDHVKNIPAQAQEVMDYFDRQGSNRLNIMHALAERYLIADHWFSSVPGPTWPNRFFVHSGTANGYVSMGSPLRYWKRFPQMTVYDRLQQRGIPWRIYFGDVAQSFMLRRLRHRPLVQHFHFMSRFFEDAAGPAKDFPAYSFIEPKYFLPRRTDQHPPHDVGHGDELIGRVYSALTKNEELWASTLLIVVYDEHGGFFDHAVPPPAVPPGGPVHEHFRFDRAGVRVPAILISPHVDQGFDPTPFDHTSILKYATEKWGLDHLSDRVDAANSLAPLIRTTPVNMEPLALAGPAFSHRMNALLDTPQEQDGLDDLQRALLEITEAMESEMDDPIPSHTLRAERVINDPDLAGELARDRVARFLDLRRNEP